MRRVEAGNQGASVWGRDLGSSGAVLVANCRPKYHRVYGYPSDQQEEPTDPVLSRAE